MARDSRSQSGDTAMPAFAASRSAPAEDAVGASQDQRRYLLCGFRGIGEIRQHLGRERVGLVRAVERDAPETAGILDTDHVRPTFARIPGSRSEISSPFQSSASDPHIHRSALATHSGGM